MFTFRTPAHLGSVKSRFTFPSIKNKFAQVFASAVMVGLLAHVVSAATFTGTNTGAIADGGSPTPTCGVPRNVAFNVTGFTSGVGAASVSFTMTPAHTWVGDLQVTLIAPDLTSHLLFSRIGANTATDVGDNANFDGTYVFNDLAAGNIWAVAASNNGNGFIVTPGSYRTQAAGPFGNDNPGPAFTSLNSTVAGIPAANVNGTWTLRFLDCTSGDTGTVSAAALTLVPTSAGDATLGGQVVTSYGAGIRNAIVTVSGGNLAGPRSVTTGTFGRYSFAGLEAGQSYVVTVAAKRFTFSTPSMFVTLDEDLDDVSFVSNQ